MKYSTFFPKSRKQEFKDDLSINAKYLIKAGYIDQLMAGSYTLLPLGFRVVENIKNIIREELNKTGAQELLMPLLHPRDIWDQTGRWSDPDVKQIMYQFKDIHGKEFGLSFTHEEIVMNLLGKMIQSYKDLPVKVYHFSTKFRNEPRAKSGILRGREFMMKDLYSAHVSEEDMYKYYNLVKDVYIKIFKRIGLDVLTVEASGGVFTDKNSHEFQVLSDVGEDTIYTCDCSDKSCDCKFSQNKEIFKGQDGDKCPECDDCIIKSAKSIEVGNIFPLGTKYSESQKVFYTDSEGNQKPIWFASYGIGPTRIMGALVEVFHDDKGIIWPKSVAPFQVYLVSLNKNDEAEKVCSELEGAGIEVLYDDRDISAGEKFANADLLGFPYRLVISEKSGDKIEFKERNGSDVELLSLDKVISRVGEEMERLT
ncbi:MAG: aminoacyl--tRNA ligase-related protein [Patescibacteria group bacterium]